METFSDMLYMQAGMHAGFYCTVRHFCPVFNRMSYAKKKSVNRSNIEFNTGPFIALLIVIHGQTDRRTVLGI
jgi:hypothetical protein